MQLKYQSMRLPGEQVVSSRVAETRIVCTQAAGCMASVSLHQVVSEIYVPGQQAPYNQDFTVGVTILKGKHVTPEQQTP